MARELHPARWSCFNPRPREGGDAGASTQIAVESMFQSTPPRRGRRQRGSRPWLASCFNPRPREGGDVSLSCSAWYRMCFNPRPREGGDARSARIVASASVLFQSTPPRRGRRIAVIGRSSTDGFNPRPREGGDHRRREPAATLRCFNPRPREGGDAVPSAVSLRFDVSIHAPAKGATMRGWLHPSGVTAFQSTPPRRGRRRSWLDSLRLTRVSIHAPAKGATLRCSDRGSDVRCFNPRPREGGDVTGRRPRWTGRSFQSTPPRRGRRWQIRHAASLRRVSIHAPAKGATSIRVGLTNDGFNPRPREGGDEQLAR